MEKVEKFEKVITLQINNPYIMTMQLQNNDYKDFLKALKQEIIQARNNALKSVNKELILLYWDIGKNIFEKQQNAQWGDNIIGQISQDLEKEFGKGFSKRNIFRMLKFYTSYKDNEKVAPLVPQISWTHHGLILDKTNHTDGRDSFRREFYMKQTIWQKWSKRELDFQLSGFAFEKWALQQTNFKDTLPSVPEGDISMLVKDSYDFSFLDLEEPFLEKQLENLLVTSIEKTLKNFWTYFSFVWRQAKIDIWGQDFYIDLLLYHRKLKCFVAIELKAGEFQAEYTGKMNLYLSALEKQEMLEWENVPIGIILCKTKNRVIVEYALKDVNKPIWVASYVTQEDLPEYLVWLLPTFEEIEREMNLLEN